ncbi:MAG: hypothetical protein V2I33_21615, partial [Kangiellaceae bacterium]|nr:hypothetical protein [Kangiellaceae bacterium]
IFGGEVEGTEVTDPLPIYKRGLYFDGTKMMTFQNLVFHNTFMLEIWVRPQANGNIFSLNQPVTTGENSENAVNILAENEIIRFVLSENGG